MTTMVMAMMMMMLMMMVVMMMLISMAMREASHSADLHQRVVELLPEQGIPVFHDVSSCIEHAVQWI